MERSEPRPRRPPPSPTQLSPPPAPRPPRRLAPRAQSAGRRRSAAQAVTPAAGPEPPPRPLRPPRPPPAAREDAAAPGMASPALWPVAPEEGKGRGLRRAPGPGRAGAGVRGAARAHPTPSPSLPTLRGVGAPTDSPPGRGSPGQVGGGRGRTGWGPEWDLAARAGDAAGEGTKHDPRVRQTERECETDRQAGRVSAWPRQSRSPPSLSVLPPSARAFAFLSAHVTMPGGRCVPNLHSPSTRARTDAHRCGRTWLQPPGTSPAETPSPLHGLADTHTLGGAGGWGRGCLEGGVSAPAPPHALLPQLPLPPGSWARTPRLREPRLDLPPPDAEASSVCASVRVECGAACTCVWGQPGVGV